MKTRKLLGFASALGMFLSLSLSASAIAQDMEEKKLDKDGNIFISGGIETMQGDTTYQIGYPVTYPNGYREDGYFPFSELKWPLDIELARVDAGIKIGSDFRLTAGVKKNVTDPDDNMEDRDWITWWNPSQLDIYSESYISDFSALIFDTEFEWTFNRQSNFAAYTGVGFLYQNFEYDANLILQYSPSGYSGYYYEGDGSVGITYDIEYFIPYLFIGMDYSLIDNFTFTGKFAYSPYAMAEDEDHHLLRENGGKVSEGDMDGWAVFLDLSARYKFLGNFFAEIGCNITRIKVEGKQDQSYVLAGPIGEVDMESTSDQYSGYLNVGFTF